MVKVLLVIDMLNDFAKKGGALYSLRIEALIPKIKEVCKIFESREDKIIFICDAHDKDDTEFQIFPPHAIADTEGAQVVENLKRYTTAYTNIVSKKRHKEALSVVEEVIVVGCCTDICVLYTVQDLANRGIYTTVVKNCVDTYDVDDETAKRLGIPPHHADELNKIFFDHMKNILGANVVEEYKVG